MNSNYTSVLSYFIIPFGMGIPGGILKAKELHVDWRMILFLYFISDLFLVLIFEPILVFIISYAKTNEKLSQLGAVFKQSMEMTTERLGTGTGPFALILFTFGADPMTGRAATVLAGHGFITGWMIAIAGDMLYFSVLMVSTLWLSSYLGDGSTTVYVILAVMILIPMTIKHIRKRYFA